MNIFIHGWSFSKYVWKDFFNLDNSMFLDLPYHGSSKEIYTENIIETYSDRLACLIQDSDEKVNLIGWSLGASICVRTVLKVNQRKLSNLILIGFSPKFKDKVLGHNPVFIKAFLVGLNIDYENTIYRFRQTATDSRFEEIPLPEKEGALYILREYIELDLCDDLQKLEVKTTLIHGKQDKIISYKGSVFAKNVIKNSKLILLNSNHAPFLQNPDLLIKVISQ